MKQTMLVIALLLVACGSNPVDLPVETEYLVRYSVNSAPMARSIAYTNTEGSMTSLEFQSLPWEQEMTIIGDQLIKLIATMQPHPDPYQMYCTITVDGEVVVHGWTSTTITLEYQLGG